jgi:hypothetical protein
VCLVRRYRGVPGEIATPTTEDKTTNRISRWRAPSRCTAHDSTQVPKAATLSSHVRYSEYSHKVVGLLTLDHKRAPTPQSGCLRVRAGWWRRRAERGGGMRVRACVSRARLGMRSYACAVRACYTASVVRGIPAVGAIRTMAVPATIIVKLSETTLRKGFGLMESNLQHKDACRVILRHNVLRRSAWSRAAVAWGLTGSSLHGPL